MPEFLLNLWSIDAVRSKENPARDPRGRDANVTIGLLPPLLPRAKNGAAPRGFCQFFAEEFSHDGQDPV